MVVSIPAGLLRGGVSYRVSILGGGGIVSSVASPVSLMFTDIAFDFNISSSTKSHIFSSYILFRRLYISTHICAFDFLSQSLS